MREILLSEIAFRNESQEIAAQFDLALNNMSHGMCMISAERRILVANARFLEFVGMPAGRSIANVHFQTLLRLAERRGAVPRETFGLLLTALDASGIEGGPRAIEFETADDSVFDITVTPNSRGAG